MVVQAKHYFRSGRSKLLTALKSEDPKVAKLKPGRYMVATSVSMTGALKDRIVETMREAPLAASDILGQEDLNNLLERHPAIEKQHFKLWLGSVSILERILHSGIYNRTETEMGLIRDLIPRFVQNNSVRAAEDILSAAGSLIVAGHPGVGKTTLARMLVWLHASQGWKIFVVDDLAEAFEISSPGEKRLIYFDDFLGQVRLSADHVRGIDQRLPPFLDRVKANKDLRFILTTREYILSQAELLSRRLASRAMSTNRYVLNVGVYTRTVRARILYNHLYFSQLSEEQIGEITGEEFYLKVIDHRNFNPRLIELLTSEEYASLSGENLRTAIIRVLDNPDELWERPYRDHISPDGKALMVAMLLFPNKAPIGELSRCFATTAAALGQDIPDAQLQPRFSDALKELEGAVLAIADGSVGFSNPGVRDFLQAVFIKDNLLPSVVRHSQNLREIRQCWAIFFNRQPKPTPLPAEAPRWIAAMDLISSQKEDELLEQLDLTLDMYDHFRDDDLVAIGRRVAARIAAVGISTLQVRDVAYALETIGLRGLSIEDQDHFHTLLTVAAAEMLKNCATELPFEDIEALDDALFEYGSDTRLAEEAVHAALDAFIPEVDDEMVDFNSIEELEEFDRKLKLLIKKRHYVGESPARDISLKRESLLETERNRDDHEAYTAAGRSTQRAEISDEQVRSMFSELVKSKG